MKSFYAFLSVCFFFSLQSIGQHNVWVDITTDDYANETSWEILDAAMNVVASDYTFPTDFTTYPTEIVNLPAGNYTFVVYDSFGDGMCCTYGDGSYTLTDEDSGVVITSGGDFGDEAAFDFTLPFVPPVMGCTNATAFNYDPLAEQDDGSCLFLNGLPGIELELVQNGFDAPVDIVHAGDDRMFIVEQDGVIKIMNSDYSVEATPFLDIDPIVASGGERGLLGLAFHPDYDSNGFFFVHYTNNGGTSTVSRFSVTANPNVADPASELIILTQSQPYSNHNAGDIAFGPDGYLYIPFGDGGSGGDPQDYGQATNSFLGNMLRIDVDNSMIGDTYDIPGDNPFIGEAGYLDEIWSIGLRNPWRISFDALTGDLYIGDVGQGSWEEIDMAPFDSQGSENYGWRCYEGNHVYNTSNCGGIPEDSLTWPVFEYNHSGGACSVTGGFVYRGSEFENLNGLYIFTDYCNGVFRGIQQAGGEWLDYELTGPQGFGWTTFGENSSLDLFVANSNGNIYKIIDPCAEFVAEITADGSSLTATAGTSYVWIENGVILEGINTPNYIGTEGNTYQVSVTAVDGCVSLSDEFTIEVPCPIDVVPDGTINILDLLLVSSNFGCSESCEGDTDLDGSVNILDIVNISSNFGGTCPL